MSADDRVDGPVGAEHEEPRGVPPARQPANQVEGGVVAPVQILDHEHEGTVGRDRIDGVAHLAQHAATRRSLDPVPQPAHLLGTPQTRHLCEPARRVPLERPHHALASRQPAEPPDRVEDGQIGLALAQVLDALPPRHPGGIWPDQAGQDGLDDRRLPDARFARDEHHLPLTAPGPRERVR